MTIGHVTPDGQAQVQVFVEGSGEMVHKVEALLDTGFNGFLALPSDRIGVLGLKEQGRATVGLASGEKRYVPTYRATVRLGEELRSIVVAEAGESLVGMKLLWGHERRVECIDGGRVVLVEPSADT